jgi:hypothetical protein
MAQKWGNNTKAATGYMAEGVDRVTEAPGKKAAAKADKMRQNINKSLDNGTWQERVASVPLEDWKNSMKTKGVSRVSEGVDGANGKVEAFATQLIAHENAGLAKIEGMPDLTLQDSKNRVITWMDHMSKFKFKR